uniref:Predicted protein n=1 Tax=Hordeum vulgare subsp. vulgare TaxID=112509 RepID=F2DDG0_HORVV|nr:predicted protein [Hordeum vulgare subsp. vulgare]
MSRKVAPSPSPSTSTSSSAGADGVASRCRRSLTDMWSIGSELLIGAQRRRIGPGGVADPVLGGGVGACNVAKHKETQAQRIAAGWEGGREERRGKNGRLRGQRLCRPADGDTRITQACGLFFVADE